MAVQPGYTHQVFNYNNKKWSLWIYFFH